MSESPPAANADYSIRADYSRSHDFVKNTLSKAAQHAAVHFYKNEIGDEEELLSQFTIHDTADDLVEKLFNDIANGDTKKLSGLLWYFKNGLVR